MSMVKSAIRTSVSKDESLANLMQRLNDVLLDLTTPGMFVTLACIRTAGEGRFEYALAGHPPILHYHSSTMSVSELRSEQVPIAMFPNLIYESRVVAVEPADLLVVVSDGFLEVANFNGDEFGLEALKRLIASSATETLPRIVDRLVEETAHFGEQQDDQTVLLVRIPRSREPQELQLG